MYRFPKALYADVRIEDSYERFLSLSTNNSLRESESNSGRQAVVRVFDGERWFTSAACAPEKVQAELDRLAALATPNPGIEEHPLVRKFEVHRARLLKYESEENIHKIPIETLVSFLEGYRGQAHTYMEEHPLMTKWTGTLQLKHTVHRFYSGKGADLVWDSQLCASSFLCCAGANDTIICFGAPTLNELTHRENEMLAEMDRFLDYETRAVNLEAGEYTCILGPKAAATLVHECFGHGFEADLALETALYHNEMSLGTKIANERVSVCDNGALPLFGYTPYDDEGTQAGERRLIRGGVLCQRLHDAGSALLLGEELSGNARAKNASSLPLIRMTNTSMLPGTDDPQAMIAEVEDGLYIYRISYGYAGTHIRLYPDEVYRIRKGRLCEPVRVHSLHGNLFEILQQIDAVGTDFEIDNSFCGKMGLEIPVSNGSPSIRIRGLTAD